MADAQTIMLAKDFSPYPAGRFRVDGSSSGEAFRETVLLPSLRLNTSVRLVLDGVAGLPSSFLEEVFGGIIRLQEVSLADLKTKLQVETSDPELKVYVPLAWKFAKDAAERLH